MAISGSPDLNPHQKKALQLATFAEDLLRTNQAQSPALTSAVLAVYYQLRSLTENPDMAEAMRQLAYELDRNTNEADARGWRGGQQ